MDTVRAYLDTAAVASRLLRDPAVAGSWPAPSALPEFGVAGLAGHLALQVLRLPEVLAGPAPDRPPVSVHDHYARAPWVGSDLDDEVNVFVRTSGERLAAGGPGALADRVEVVLAELRDTLPAAPADRTVALPMVEWSLSLRDYLLARMLELVIHSDDLAVSVGVPTPEFDPDVIIAVVDILSRAAVRRHGPVAVLRAFSRAERAPATISAL